MLIQAPLCSYQQDLACISSRCIFSLVWAELSMSPSCHPISAWKYPSMSRDNELERWGPTPAKAILPHHGSTDRSTCSCIVEQVPRWVQWALAESGEVWYGCVSRFPPHLVVFPHTWDYTDDASVDTSIVNNNKKLLEIVWKSYFHQKGFPWVCIRMRPKWWHQHAKEQRWSHFMCKYGGQSFQLGRHNLSRPTPSWFLPGLGLVVVVPHSCGDKSSVAVLMAVGVISPSVNSRESLN